MNKYINGFVEVVTIGDDKVSRVWSDGGWQYDSFCTRLSGALTSTPSPCDWKYPEGQVYTVTLCSSDETYSRNFRRYAEARGFLRRVTFAKSIHDALEC